MFKFAWGRVYNPFQALDIREPSELEYGATNSTVCLFKLLRTLLQPMAVISLLETV